jgi:Ca2+-binding EF-hand superfamily protein
MTLKEDRPLPKGVRARTTAEGVTLSFGTTRLDLRASRQMRSAPAPNVRAQLKMLFSRLDRDGKGYVAKKDVGRGSPLFSIFDALDRDGDGKVTQKELLAWCGQMEALGKLAQRSCVSLVFSNEGKGLFDLLDTDGDGRLSIRELRNAPNLLTRLGVGRDGKLTRAQIPRHYQAGLALGPTGGNDGVRRAVFFGPPRGVPNRRRVAPRGPLWFQKMDRNRDGDVSRKEFLGTDEQFRAIDTDGDGLISAEEAEAYDRRPRQDGSDRKERRRR